MPLSIKALAESDLPEVAALHVQAWREAYAGQIEQSYLDGLCEKTRLLQWRDGFARRRGDPRFGTLVARLNGMAAGFMSFGPARDDKPAAAHEIYAVNIIRPHWGMGIGWGLYQDLRRRWRAQGVDAAYLWVLRSNANALGAYQRWGGTANEALTKDVSLGARSYQEVTVTFDLAKETLK